MSAEAGWLSGLEDSARSRLPAELFEYISQGAREGITAAEAVESWQGVRFRSRVLRDVASLDLMVQLLGSPSSVPWGVAPTTLQRSVHPEGELAMARATAAVGGVMVVSSNAGTTFAELRATGVHWWLQAYLPEHRQLAEPLLARAVEAGAGAVVLTADTPVVGTKYAAGASVWDSVEPATLRVNFDPGYESHPASRKARDLAPDDIAWLGELTGLPVVVKGVLHPDDVEQCLEAGAEAVWVSNHGGRQLDRALSTAAALPAVVDAVRGRAEVYVDGGLRTGLDILAALALGADAVFLGRLPLYALVDGEKGVARMHEELSEQVAEALRLAGVGTVADARGALHDPPI